MKLTSKYFKDQPKRMAIGGATKPQVGTTRDLQEMLKARCKEAALKPGIELLEQEVEGLCGSPENRRMGPHAPALF